MFFGSSGRCGGKRANSSVTILLKTS